MKSDISTCTHSLCINKYTFLLSPSFSRQRFLSASFSALRWLSRLLCCSRAFSLSSCLRLDSRLFLLPTWKKWRKRKHCIELLYGTTFPLKPCVVYNIIYNIYNINLKQIGHFDVTIRILQVTFDTITTRANVQETNIYEWDRTFHTQFGKPGRWPSKY